MTDPLDFCAAYGCVAANDGSGLCAKHHEQWLADVSVQLGKPLPLSSPLIARKRGRPVVSKAWNRIWRKYPIRPVEPAMEEGEE